MTTEAASTGIRALIWAQECTWRQRTLQAEPSDEPQRDELRRHDGVLLSDRERARLTFLRWLY